MKIHKLLFKTTIALLFSITTNAQNINGGFEQWDSVETVMFTNYMPKGWLEFMNAFCQDENLPWSVTQSTDAHSGSSAMQIKNIATSMNQTATVMTNSEGVDGGFNNKIPVNARYTRLEGYYKYTTVETDTFNIMVLMMKGEDFIAVARYEQAVNTSNYTKFSVPIIYSAGASIIPDSAVIMISAGSTDNFREGSTLLVDDIAFTLSSGVDDIKEALHADVSVFPNPASEFVNVSVKGAKHGNVTIDLINIIGQTLKKEEVKPTNQQVDLTINLSDAPKGVLFVKVSDGSGSQGYKILNQ